MTDPAALKAALGAIVAMPAPSVCATRIARFANEPDNVSLEETQLVAAALAALPTCPKLALPLLRELVRVGQLVTVQSVFDDFVVAL